MSKIKLPQPLRNIVHNSFFGESQIMEAYVDEVENKNFKKNNLKGLRSLLEVSQNESICDCFCKVAIVGVGERNILFEDKNSRHTKRFRDAIEQLKNTLKLCEEKEIKIDFAIICRVSVEPPFSTRKEGSPLKPFKVVFVKMNGRPVELSNSNKVPLLHN